MPALLVLCALLLARGQPERLVFYALAAGCFALHAIATHHIPRYSWPLIPVATLALLALPGIWRDYRSRPQRNPK